MLRWSAASSRSPVVVRCFSTLPVPGTGDAWRIRSSVTCYRIRVSIRNMGRGWGPTAPRRTAVRPSTRMPCCDCTPAMVSRRTWTQGPKAASLAFDLAALPHDERLRSTLKSMSSQAYASKPIVERIRSSRAPDPGPGTARGDEGVHVKRSLGSPWGGRPGCQAVSAAGAGRWPWVPRPVGVLVASGGG